MNFLDTGRRVGSHNAATRPIPVAILLRGYGHLKSYLQGRVLAEMFEIWVAPRPFSDPPIARYLRKFRERLLIV